MALRVKVSARASSQIEAAAQWWQANRPAAPGAIAKDVGEAIELLALQPGIGSKCQSKRIPEVRRLFMGRIRYFIYYREHAGTLQVLALWHESRGKQPSL